MNTPYPVTLTHPDVTQLDQQFAPLSATERVEIALEQCPGVHVLSSSFGAQSAVSLHLLNTVAPGIPVVLIDTGYLFEATYRFVEVMVERLDLNLQVYANPVTPARQEALYGQRWTQGLDGLEQYNRDNKVQPMHRALSELGAGTWFTGLRRDQATTRKDTPFVQVTDDGVYKVAPLADWGDRDVHQYLQAHALPYHPLWHEGYISIGDVHSTKSIYEVDSVEQTRFFGLKRECGLHE
ncbi:MAG: phosphoadenylyl-sulfate reductase [Pseudomonadota bacterium]